MTENEKQAENQGHTPGPWFVAHNKPGTPFVANYREISAGDGLCEAFDSNTSTVEGCGFNLTGYISESDALLIASAPALLAENAALREAGDGLLAFASRIEASAWYEALPWEEQAALSRAVNALDLALAGGKA